ARHEEAEHYYREAIRSDPTRAQPYVGIADLRFAAGRAKEALAFYRRALQLAPKTPEIWHNIGVIERHLHNFPNASAAFSQALRLKPDYSNALGNLVSLARQLEQPHEILELIRELDSHHPGIPQVKAAEAEVLLHSNDTAGAFKILQELHQQHPEQAEICNLLGLIHLRRGNTRTALSFFVQAREQVPDKGKYHDNLLYTMIADPDSRATDYRKEARRWWRQCGTPLAATAIPIHNNDLKSGRKLRLAFISGDFHRHPVSYFLLPLLNNLDRTRFEVYGYSDTCRYDQFTQKIESLCDVWNPISGLDDQSVASLIRHQRIDLLVELSGHTSNNRLEVLARQPAPVQFSWLGYPGSTGLGNHTFRISDYPTDPPELEKQYTEKLVRLETPSLCYTPPPEAIELVIAKQAPLPNETVFASFNNPGKLNPRVIALWAQILKRLPRSRLLLKYQTFSDTDTVRYFRELFQQQDIPEERLIFSGEEISTEKHFLTYNQVAIALDPFPYNGTTTTFDALWMGTPVITLRGDRHAARIGGTILETIGYADLIADSEQEYLEKAVQLAQNPVRLKALHKNLRNRLRESPLMQGRPFAAAFGRALEEKWHEWRNIELEVHQRLAREWGTKLGLPENLAELLDNNPKALGLLRQAAAREPARPFLRLGQYYTNEDEPEKACHCFSRALHLEPENPIIRFTLGHSLHNLKRSDEALCHYLAAFTADPQLTEAALNAGKILLDQQQFLEAEQILRQGLEKEPDNPDLNLQLASACYSLRKPEQAYQALTRCLTKKPQQGGLWNNIGILIHESGKPADAIKCFQHALEIDPELDDAHANLLWSLAQACIWDKLDEEQRLCRHPAPMLSLIFYTDPQRNRDDARHRIEHYFQESSIMLPPPSTTNNPKSPIRIGYLSCDFQDHPVAHNILNLFRLHDRNHFHVTAYSCGKNDDSPYRRQITRDCDSFVDLRDLSDREAAARIAADRTDILIELMGHTRDNRLGICAHRPVPIQISYLGYPGTTGADFIDYIIADKIVIPPEEQQFYSEKPIYLPDSFMIADQASIAKRPIRRECGLPETGFIFCSFNSPFKLEPVMFNVWMDILKAVPGSILWLRECHQLCQSNLCREAEKRGIDAKRLIFAPRVPTKAEHLARLQLADLALDTRIYNGHTTTLDALWAGVPVLTLKGAHFASRVSESNLNAVGLPEMVTGNLEGYRRRAIDLAHDSKSLAAIRQQLAENRQTHPLFNTEATVRKLEAAYRTVWLRYKEGRPATVIHLQDQA
ncbi:MAG: tetratricopeptide repeat protein, partial [Deltaproteobacteria bacterium]|nr:tetratricopeptide repeat protein [Deltaproteobacteria bacterium]